MFDSQNLHTGGSREPTARTKLFSDLHTYMIARALPNTIPNKIRKYNLKVYQEHIATHSWLDTKVLLSWVFEAK